MSKKILITGSDGFIGKNLKIHFENHTDNIVLSPNLKALDLCKHEDVKTYLRKNKPDIIIHSASTLMVNKGYSDTVCEDNLRMFFNLYEKKEAKTKLINLGSGSEYSRAHWKKNMKEEYFGKNIPVDSHSYSKYIISNFIENKDSEDLLNLRIFGIYGEFEDYKYKFISNCIAKNILNLPIIINQNCKFDYIHVRDFCKICEKLINKSHQFSTYNVTPDISIDLKKIAQIVNTVSRKNLEIKLLNKGIGTYYTGNNKRLKQELSSFKFTSYVNGIKDLYKKLEDNRENLKIKELRKDVFLNYAKKNKERYFK
ncbi:NAD(P)-dependent oxidoreductase [Rickettsiales bacterium]|nr:NAD(P)-dependent oxidoreductase [Rickettsiales bacterium]